MGRMKTKTFVVTGLAILGLFAGGQALAADRVPPPQADATAAAAETLVRPDDRETRVSPVSPEQATRPDDRAVRVTPVTPAGVVRPDDRAVRVTPGTPIVVVRPDDRAVRVTPVDPAPSAVRPDDRPGVRGPGLVPEAAPAPITVISGGFDLGDAAIGAGFALGLIGLLLVGIYTVRTRRPLAH